MIDLSAARADHQAGNFPQAEMAYRAALRVDPASTEANFLLGTLLTQSGRPEEGTGYLRRAVANVPTHAKAHNALGVALSMTGDTTGAEAAFRASLALAPDFTDPAHNLARILSSTRPTEAETLLCQIIERVPDFAAAHSDLGTILHRSNRRQQAECAFLRAFDLNSSLVEPARNLAVTFKTEGRHEDARAIAPRLTDPLARFMAATTTPGVLDNADAIPAIEADYLAALSSAPHQVVTDPMAAFGALGHFYFAYYDRPLRAIHEATAATYRRMCPTLVHTAEHCRRPRPRRARPRVAIVSAHYHSHTIHRLFAGVIIGLADSFDVVAVAAPGRTDASTDHLRQAVPFIRLPSDFFRARQVLADLEADAIIYLDIGMEPFTYFLAHARLAPLQLVTWGHPVTPGLDTIDGFVSADYLDPPGADEDHTERLYRLPAPAYFFDRPEVPERDRAHFGLPEKARLYVCPQTLFKFHPDFDGMIADTLRADPAGRLVLLDGGVPARRTALERRFAHTMPDVAERVLFLPSLSRTDFLSLLRVSDVMLDIPTFSGGNTTLEGLAAGVPVVTMPSSHLRGRLTAGLLRLAGLEQGIAASPAEYCRIATDAAQDGAAYRAAIREQAGGLFQRRQAISDMRQLLCELLGISDFGRRS